MVSPMKNNMKNGQTSASNRNRPVHTGEVQPKMHLTGKMKTGNTAQMRSGLSQKSQMLKPITSVDAARAKAVVGSMAKVVEAKVEADDLKVKEKDSMSLLMPATTVDAGKEKVKAAVRVAKEKAKHSKVTKERKEEKVVYILLMPCLPQRLLPRLQLQLPNLKKKLLKPLRVHQKAQVVAVNVVLGGMIRRIVPP